MPIPPIGAISPAALSSISSVAPASSGAAGGSGGDFGKMITDAIKNLSQTEQGTTDLVNRAAAGDNVDIHDVMIAAQTESLTFQTALQVRNKMVEAYQEVFRMQM